jgi:hypothetical protein
LVLGYPTSSYSNENIPPYIKKATNEGKQLKSDEPKRQGDW